MSKLCVSSLSVALALAAGMSWIGLQKVLTGPSEGQQLRKVSLEDVDPTAVCGDESPAAYYWAPSSTASSLWIVDLQGGGWCYDADSCAKRCPEGSTQWLCSSKSYPDNYTQDGLFHPAHNDKLETANKVFVPYCTSDAHMGDNYVFGRPFKGQRVVQAVLQDLVKRHGLGQRSSKDTVIFGGQSAGGRGAMVHLDYVQEMIGNPAALNVEVVGLLDSPLWIDVPPYGPSGFVGFGAMCKSAYENFGITHLDTECVVAHPDADDVWKCVMGEYRIPHIKTPYMIVASQYDSFQLGMNKIRQIFPSTAEKKYAAVLANRTSTLMKTLKENWSPTAARPNAVLSWACYDHASSLSHRGFDEQTCQHTTLDAAFTQYFDYDPLAPIPQNYTPPALEWVDDCKGFVCGSGCRSAMPVAFEEHLGQGAKAVRDMVQYV